MRFVPSASATKSGKIACSNKEIIVRLFKNPRSTEERPIIKQSLLAQPALVKANAVSSDVPCVSEDRVDAHPTLPALLKVTIKSSGVLKEPTSPKTVNKVLDVIPLLDLEGISSSVGSEEASCGYRLACEKQFGVDA
ncbi:hypothetical protein G6F68_015790 [Rhizopus microsporus]|nr:hypothetical protein G6F68_015790 [Rhizopus microsporus]